MYISSRTTLYKIGEIDIANLEYKTTSIHPIPPICDAQPTNQANTLLTSDFFWNIIEVMTSYKTRYILL